MCVCVCVCVREREIERERERVRVSESESESAGKPQKAGIVEFKQNPDKSSLLQASRCIDFDACEQHMGHRV